MTLNDWHQANPIRRWREDREMPAMTMAGLLGVTVTTLSRWERGAAAPTAHIGDIADLMGREATGLAIAWEQWRDMRKLVDLGEVRTDES